MNLYLEKETDYFDRVRYNLIRLLPANSNSRVLESGAGGGGDTLVELKKRKLAKEVIGVELMQIEQSNLTNTLINKFLVANIEDQSLPMIDAHFDAILIGDVFEHLSDACKTITSVSTFLKPGGVFIVRAPNIRYYTALNISLIRNVACLIKHTFAFFVKKISGNCLAHRF